MFKTAFIIGLVVVASKQAQARQVVLRNGFTEYSIAQGIGETSELAYEDAISAIPKNYEHEKDSPQFSRVVNGKYQVSLSILPKDEELKAEYLEIRKGRKRYIIEGFGSSIAEAKNDVRKKITKRSVIDSWLLGCSLQNGTDEKGQLTCDQKIPGNRYKVSVIIFASNADTF